MIRLLPILVFTAIFSLLFVALLDKPQDGARLRSGEMIDRPLPTLEVYKADGNSDTIKADGVMLLNVFASWCSPCAAEMPELMALKKANPNVKFVGVVWNDSPSNIAVWLKKHGNPFNSVYYDPTGRVGIAMGMRGIPESFVTDKDGIIRFHMPGALKPELREKEADPLLKELANAP